MTETVLQFLVSAGVIVVAGTLLTRFGDTLSARIARLDPSRADAAEGVASPLTPLGAARTPGPDATRTPPSDGSHHSHHGHATDGAHEPTEEPPR